MPTGSADIQHLISDGINVNVTLLFQMPIYEAVAEAYISGLEAFEAGGGDPSGVASVASFFISRIDSAIDNTLEARLKTAQSAEERMMLRSLQGKVAIANARVTYQRYKEIYRGARWQALAAKQ